jgi:acetyltransferase
MKIVSSDIIHKTDAGGVNVGVKDKEEALEAYQEIISKAIKYNWKAQIYGAIVHPIVSQGTDIIIRMMKDPNFSPVIMFGLGGNLCGGIERYFLPHPSHRRKRCPGDNR